MTIKVRMLPHLDQVESAAPSGIMKVVEKYFQHLPAYDVELVGSRATSYDLLALHAGAYDSFSPNDPIVAHCHGLYWTDDYVAAAWEQEGNQRVIDVLRHATLVTVPSPWVAEAFQRDMHLSPAIVPHGVDWEEWQGGVNEGYILWNKNRATDVCDPMPVNELAQRMPQQRFITTFASERPPRNVRVLGNVRHDSMMGLVKGAALYLATTKETFGIGTLEALAAGVPVLGFDWGHTAHLVQHGVNGYLARPYDYDDLLAGANYLLKRRAALSLNAREAARGYSWPYAAHILAEQYARTLSHIQRENRLGVVIPCYNKAATLERAVRSALNQTLPPDYIVIVNNNSTDESAAVMERLSQSGAEAGRIYLANCPAQGVAHARNWGISILENCDYICCLDADDEIAPTFLQTCVRALQGDNSLAIAYTGIEAVNADGSRFLSQWPGDFDYEQFIVGKNQVPTCNVFRREMWRRAGGYRQRFAPNGAGAEDAELWLRIGALGGNAKKVSDQGLFIYHLGGQVSGDAAYQEPNWRAGKPWIEDGRHPFASIAQPANGVAHLVRQVDDPLISIIIPLGPGHWPYLQDCLDSIEAQGCRQWEAVVVADVGEDEWAQVQRVVGDGFPFVRLLRTGQAGRGAGYARNRGVESSRGPLLLFLDADDWLLPNALNTLLAAYADNPLTVIYGEYIGHAIIHDRAELQRLDSHKRLLAYNEQTEEATVLYHVPEYECERALQQPDARRPYIWSAVTSLLPRTFHFEIGGFDESMLSWEDWDYWLRLARSDHCFTRVQAPIFEYRFYSGGRRALANPTESGENGRQLSTKLLSYMQDKYERDGAMPCRSCGGRRKPTPPSPTPMMAMTLSEGGVGKMSSGDYIEVELIDGNVGMHRIVFQRENYGYRSHGDKFLMRRDHADQDHRVTYPGKGQPAQSVALAPSQPAPATQAASPQALVVPPAAKRALPPEAAVASDEDEYFEEDDSADEDEAVSQAADRLGLQVERSAPATEGVRVVSEEQALAEGESAVKPKATYDFISLWGIGPERQDVLIRNGVRSLTGLIALDVTGIGKLLDVPEKTAERILRSAKEAQAK